MPVINAFADHPTHPYVRVQANWADTPSVTHAAVYRVDVETGECTPLRPYICYDGWELLLSCGHGTWWDTEAPFDRPFYYITSSSEAPCLPAAYLLLDVFGRTSASTWTTATSGQAYTIFGGVNGNYTVAPGFGSILVSATGSDRFTFADVGTPDQDATITIRSAAVPVGGTLEGGLAVRYTDSANHYLAYVQISTAGAATLVLGKRVATVATTLASTTLTLDPLAADYQLRIEANGSTIRTKAWSSVVAEPEAWDLEVTDTSLTTGNNAAAYARRGAGNASPTTVRFSDFTVSAPCVPCTPVTATAPTEITLASDGRFWLKDPVRPCHDRPVPLCQTDAPLLPICGGGSGILFVGTGPEIYPANSFSLRPMNRRRNLSATRPRGDAVSSLRLQTLTFTDRDDLLALAAPGSLLLWQGPAEYGISDRYMNVADVQVSPELPDLRVQLRTEVLPYDIQDRPAGPTQGICGARVADICDLYPTWDDLAATGMTWDDLVAGQASPASASPDQRTWNDVNSDFASWNAVNTGGRTWNDLQAGD